VVARAGLLTTVQDLGRHGAAHLGVSPAGAADPASLRLANRLVGNPEAAAGLETTLLGADVRLTAARWVAVTGAGCEVAIRVDGRDHPTDADRPRYLRAGATLSIGPARWGVRSYLAVSGGIAVEPTLGSRSTDTLSRLGPPPLKDGDVLPLGDPGGEPAAVDVVPRPSVPAAVDVRLVRGPRDRALTDAALRTLTGRTYQVTPESDRVGVRLDGPPLERSGDAAVPSEGIVLGAVQVPPSGLPLVFLADHPTTGGYPVVAVVHPADLWLVAQSRPGTSIRFHWHARPPRPPGGHRPATGRP
jgi:biotin-dependent carboxylase-like uncharacterized protein